MNEEKQDQSIFAEFAWKFLERDISVVPIAPGSKKPGQYSQEQGWRGMGDWTRFAQRMPTDIEIEHWEKWPDAGIGVVLGKLSGLVALDKDYDLPGGGNDALQALIPYSPVAKKGEKGWTRFYRWNGEKSCSFDVGGMRVLDVLSDGRQTVVPPTIHPTGLHYTWITEDTLDSLLSVSELPMLPDDFLQQVEKVLAPYQSDNDKKHQKRHVAPKEDDGHINTDLSIQAEYFRDLNAAALSRLDDWVPKIIPTAKADHDGFRCIATWRNCKNPNVGIHPHGIRDWGGGYGMTAVDLVMYANGMPFQRAAESLRNCLALSEPEPIQMTVGGQPQHQAHAPTPAPAKLPPLPWQKMVEQPAPVMLPPTTSDEPAMAIPRFITNPPGILNDIAAWITATAPKAQPELSLAAAISLGATCTQRIYRSNLANFTSLYMVMVAKSTEGKEHPQSCVERVLTAAGLQSLIAGSGYTSAGAVFSALLRQPSHIAIIDEMGKLLKLSRSKGNANSEAAIDKLVEAFGKLNGVIRPPVYSTMTMTKAQAGAMQGAVQMIHNPAVSILGATTPSTFYGNLTDDLVQDGFLGRLIVVESSQPRQLARFVDQTDPPARIVEWCKKVNAPAQRTGNLSDIAMAEMPATTVGMEIRDECQELMRAFETELNQLKDQFEPEHLDVLLGRTFEKALRLAMIAAKACDPNTVTVRREHLEWAISYVRHYDMAMIRAVRKNRIVNQIDTDMKKAVDYIKGARKYASDPKLAHLASVLASGAMPRQLLLKKMHMKASEFNAMIDTAIEAGIITRSPGVHLNYAGDVYYCADHD
jgi:hypothetical protein